MNHNDHLITHSAGKMYVLACGLLSHIQYHQHRDHVGTLSTYSRQCYSPASHKTNTTQDPTTAQRAQGFYSTFRVPRFQSIRAFVGRNRTREGTEDPTAQGIQGRCPGDIHPRRHSVQQYTMCTI